MEGILYRKASADDLESIVSVERESFDFPWPLSAFRQELQLPFSTLLLAEGPRGQGIVGFVDYWVRGDELHLLVLAVGRSHRRQGIGRELIRRAEAAAAADRARYVLLEVRQGNDAALAFYRDLGYAHVGVKRGYYSDNGEDALVLMKFMSDAPERTTHAETG